MQSTAPQFNSQSDNINTMQPQQTQNMYAPTSGTANSSNIRTNQQAGIFRGANSSNPSPRAGTRQVSMQNIYQQPIQHGLLMSAFGAYPPRQPTYQNPQAFPFPHSTMPPPQSYYFPSLYMPTQPQHRATMSVNTGVSGAMSGPNVQLAGPPGAAQGQIPISAAQVVTGAVPPGAPAVIGVGPTTAQVQTSQIVGLVSGNIPTHPPQTSKQPKSHPNRLKIIDPNTNKNILDEFELNKPSTNADVEYQDLQLPTTTQGDYQLTSAPSTDHTGLTLSSGVLLIPDTRPSLPYNVRYDTDVQQIQHQRDLMVSQTPVVSAMSDAPSIEIPPTQKPRSKKIAITAPKPENILPVVASNSEEKEKEANHTTELKQFDGGNSTIIADNQEQAVTNDRNAENNYEQLPLEPSCSIANEESPLQDVSIQAFTQTIEKSQSEKFVAEDILSIENIEKTLVNMKITTAEVNSICEAGQSSSGEFIPSSNSVNIQSLTLEQETEKHNFESKTKTDSVSNLSHTINKNNILDATSNVDQLNAVTFLNSDTSEQEMCDETDRAINIATVSADADSKDNILELMQKNTTIDKTNELNAGSTSESNREDEAFETATSKESNDSHSDTISNSVLMNSLITYNEGQWSPNNPDGKKQYNRKQLMRLREAQASRIQPAVKNTSILTQKNFMPSFIKYNNNKRGVQSMMGSIGGNRGGDMIAGNYGNKQSSMSGVYGRSMGKDKIQVNLSLNQDVKLNETDNAWRPRVLLKGEAEVDSQSNTEEKEELIRRVRGILNKLTPEKFDTLVEEIIKLKIDTPDKMEDVMVLVFEKAIDEPNFSVSYARLCHRLISEVKARDERMESDTKTNLALFRSALIDKTEREFVQNVTGTSAKEEKLKPIIEKIKSSTDLNEKAELEALLEEEERKIRRRSVGTVRFIGELFKISMLTGKIINSCIDTLLRNNNEDMLECLCKLLTTVGAKFEQTLKNPKEDQKTFHSLDKTMARMQAIASKTDKDAKVSSRVRFMLQDVIDLRKKNWQLTRNEAPKTMEQIEKETKSAQLSSHFLNYGGSLSTSGSVNSNGPQMGSNNKRDDRGGNRFGDSRSGYGGSHSQRGEAGSMRRQQGGSNSGNSGGLNVGNSNGTNDDNTWHVKTGKGSRSTGIDTNKLEGLLNQNLDMKKMGGLSQFVWNKDIRQSSIPSTTPSNSFAALSSLIDSKNSDRDLDHDRDRDRDRGGPRNKGSYNKNSMERERYGGDRGMSSRSVTSQGARENSSSRNSQGMRGMMNASSMQKSTSQSKYSHQLPSSRLTSKSAGISTISSGPTGLYHRGDQSASSEVSSYTATPTVYEEPSTSELQLIKTVVTDLLEGAANTNTINSSVVSCFSRINPNQRCAFLAYILTDYLHLAGVCQIHRRYLANIVDYLLKAKTIGLDHFRLAYKHFCSLTNDLIVDIPDLWLYVIEFTGPLIAKQTITVKDLWNKQLIEENVNCSYSIGKKFLKTFLEYCTREIGPNFTRSMWKNFNMKWTDFVPVGEVQTFIESNHFDFIEDESKQAVIEVKKESKEKLVTRIVERIDSMLREGSSKDSIIDYVNGNIVDIDKFFIRNLTTTLCNFSIAYKDEIYKLDIDRFQKECIPLLQRYINSEPERELECLTAMQVLVNKLEHPRDLLCDLFGELYCSYVIRQESFMKWRDSKDQSAGKGVAVKGLNHFFNTELSGETSDENNC